MTATDSGSNRPVATLDIMRQSIKQSPFTTHLGAEVTVCHDGRAELVVPFRPDLTQHHGVLHGAVVGAIADNAMSWAAASAAGDVVTSEYKLNLLGPGVGERFIGRGQVVKAGRRQVVARAEVFAERDGREKLIAVATGTIVPV